MFLHDQSWATSSVSGPRFPKQGRGRFQYVDLVGACGGWTFQVFWEARLRFLAFQIGLHQTTADLRIQVQPFAAFSKLNSCGQQKGEEKPAISVSLAKSTRLIFSPRGIKCVPRQCNSGGPPATTKRVQELSSAHVRMLERLQGFGEPLKKFIGHQEFQTYIYIYIRKRDITHKLASSRKF